MKTVIMAGGRGTRLSSLFSDIPKPMVRIDGLPVLEREVECLRTQGFTEIIITVSHLGNIIMDHFGNGSRFGVKIEYFVEEKPLGNAGALFKLRNKLNDDFLLLNGDAIFDIDFNRFVEYHKQCGGTVTLFTHPNSHPYDSGLIISNMDGQVAAWLAKEDSRPTYYHNRVNAGLHVLNVKALDESGISSKLVGSKTPDGKVIKVDLDRQILKPLAGTGKMYCYDSPEYVKDMGTPERFASVEEDFKNGIVKTKNLHSKQKAIFLDRDGTINKYVGFLRKPEEFELIPGVAEAIQMINASGYLAIVVTNQPVIARGEVTYEELDNIHRKMETLLGNNGAYIDGLFFCPHHPDKGFAGEITELKIECDCRKPKPGLFFRAAEKFNIDLSKSFMIGDSNADIIAGEKAGCTSILIDQNKSGALKESIRDILSMPLSE